MRNSASTFSIFSFVLLTLTALFLLLPSSQIQAAELRAYLDKNVVQMGQFIQLSVTLNGKSSADEPDFSVLQNDFEVLSGISQSSQTQIINGSISSSKTWSVTITPKKDGAVVIPPISMGQLKTDAITVVVGKAPEKQYSDVFFETHVSSKSVYVQQQLRLDLKLYVRLSDISNSQLEELEIENAQVIPIGKPTQGQVIKDGVRYYLVESSFFIFPEKSGVLKIPSLSYSAVMNEGSRYSRYANRRRVSAQSDALQITVKAIPSSFPVNAVWLPATNIMLAESFNPSEEAAVGEPITRNIITKATGLPASALPPAKMETSNTLKVYPDQGSTDDKLEKNHLTGTRTDSFALIAGEVGDIELPSYRLPWWDVNADKLRYAELSEKQLSISGNANDKTATANEKISINQSEPQKQTQTQANSQETLLSNTTLLLLVAAFLFIWLLTILGFIFYIRKIKSGLVEAKDTNPTAIAFEKNLKESLSNLNKACTEKDAKKIREALLIWANIYFKDENIHGLSELSFKLQDENLKKQLLELDSLLYKKYETLEKSDLSLENAKAIYEDVKNISKTEQANKKTKKGTQLKELYHQ